MHLYNFAAFMKRRWRKYGLVIFILLITAVIIIWVRGCSEIPVTPLKSKTIPSVRPGIFKNCDSVIIARKASELDEIFTRLQKTNGLNGNVLYAEKGRIIFKKSYGYRDIPKQKDPLQITDAFQLASVSKMFAAMSIMILKERGQVEYDRDIREYLPEFPYKGITVRMLMIHRAGMPNYMSLADEMWIDKTQPLDNSDMLELLFEFEPRPYFSPNNGFSYSNTNYALLANIVEDVSGKYFDVFVKEEIFDPLQMDNSFVYNLRGVQVLPEYVEKGVPGYYHRGRKWIKMPNDYLNGVMGDKNVYTTVEDLFKFNEGLDQFTLVKKETLKEAFTRGSPKRRANSDNYGFGWRIKGDLPNTVYHFGWWKGFRTFYIRDMKHQKTLIVLTNKDKGPGSTNLWDIIKSDTLPIGPCSTVKPARKK